VELTIGFANNTTEHTLHPYQVIEQCALPIIHPDWSADEELLLIEALEYYGLGNWADVAEQVTSRSKEELERHYLDCYVHSSDYPFPVVPRGAKLTQVMDKVYSTDPGDLRAKKKRRIDDRRAASKLPLQTKFEILTSVPSRHEVAGYMPGRLEFETEFFNEADERVKDMIFDDDPGSEDPGEVDLKLAVLDIYNSNLTKRSEKKRVIFEHGFLEYKKRQQWEKRWTKEERDIVNKTKPLARLQNSADYEVLVEGLLAEHKTRQRIAELQEYRRNGCITLDQGQKYERDKATRQSALRNTSHIFSTSLSSRYSRPMQRLPSTAGMDEPFSLIAHPSRESTPSLPLNHPNLNPKQPRKPANPLNISNAADLHLLSPSEQTLCSQLRILPKSYLVIKETLFRELLRTGGTLRKRQARELIKIDVNKTARIFEYFQQQGWLRWPGVAQQALDKSAKERLLSVPGTNGVKNEGGSASQSMAGSVVDEE
jgi:transcriptional adapter 2-alpha